jgi:hypothetical protein
MQKVTESSITAASDASRMDMPISLSTDQNANDLTKGTFKPAIAAL